MSVLSLEVVVKCNGPTCDRVVIISDVKTEGEDPEGTELQEMVKNLTKVALCDHCQQRLNYHTSQGRGQDWLVGRV